MAGSGLSTVQVLFLVGEAAAVLLGLAVGYVAYRGYRRNDARPMLFVAAGFFLALGVPPALAAVAFAVPWVTQVQAGLVSQACEVTGLASILYGLWR